jgi:hypothetical protein
VDAGDIAGVPGGDEVDDDVPRNERNLMVTMAASIFSRRGSRGRLEVRGATMSFGLRWGGRLAANWVMPEGSEDARDPITRWSTEKGRRYPLLSSESCGYACRYVGLRRGIPMAWRHDLQGNEGGKGEEAWGYL